MDNLITSVLSAAVFLSFVVGLAVSIGAVPFFIIVFAVGAMLLIDLYEDNIGIVKALRAKK